MRKTGEHVFVPAGGHPVCGTCGCDEDDAYVGGQKCTFVAPKPKKIAKPPFQLIITDDDGREVFSRYVDLTNDNGHMSLLHPEQVQRLVSDMSRAINKPKLDGTESKWYAS